MISMGRITSPLESAADLFFWVVFYGSQLFFVGAVARLFLLMLSPQLLPGWTALALGIGLAGWFMVALGRNTKDSMDIIANAVIIGIIVLVLTPLLVKVKNDILQRPGLPPAKVNRAS